MGHTGFRIQFHFDRLAVHLAEPLGGEDFHGSAGGRDPPFREQRAPVGVGGGEIEVVEHDHDRPAFFGQRSA